MSENLLMLRRKLDVLSRMQADVQHSVGKIPGPLEKTRLGDVSALTADERETISAFTTRFASYQEQLGKAMRAIAIEEEAPTSPFGAILALMEKLEILPSAEIWKEVRELRNLVNHEYEDDPVLLAQVLSAMMDKAGFLMSVHERLAVFVATNY